MVYSEFFAPTHVFFGCGVSSMAAKQLRRHSAHRVLVVTGKAHAARTGLKDSIIQSLLDNGLKTFELSGVKPNPLMSLALEGVSICRDNKVDYILAIGGGSVIDTAKCIACSSLYSGDMRDLYNGKRPQKKIPVAVIVTSAAAGSEMSNSSVMTDDITEGTGPDRKKDMISDLSKPELAFLDPELTVSCTDFQTVLGSTDIIMHTLERFFHNGPELELTDSIAADTIKAVINNTSKALQNPSDLDARSNLLWAASVSHNGLTAVGYHNRGDWSCHMIEHSLSSRWDIPHASGLSILWPAWAAYVSAQKPERFAQLGGLVFGISAHEPRLAAHHTIRQFEELFQTWNLPSSLSQASVNASKQDLLDIADSLTDGGKKCIGSYAVLSKEDILAILDRVIC